MSHCVHNTLLKNSPLPADIVLSPSWWYHQAGITFDRDFFFHPAKRVEIERKMEQVLYDRWGRFGLGADRHKDLPQIGAVHLAAGFLLPEMLGCRVEYNADTAPQVTPAGQENLVLDTEQAFHSPAFNRFLRLMDSLKGRFGYVRGDVHWSGVLNLAMQLRGARFFADLLDHPASAQAFLRQISYVIEKFALGIEKETGTTSISVNRIVRFFEKPIFLHPECSLTKISPEDYGKFLMPIDRYWSGRYRPFGIQYCATDPSRYAEVFARLPSLDFLDAEGGGNVRQLREGLPGTFLNIRLSPKNLVRQPPDEIRQTVIRLIQDSGDPYLTGICCVNIENQTRDEQVTAIFEAVAEWRKGIFSQSPRIVEMMIPKRKRKKLPSDYP